MNKKTHQSVGYAMTGLRHAIHAEANLRRFIFGHMVLMLLGVYFRIDIISIAVLTFVAGGFIIVELLNTALERIADTFDDCEKTHRGGHYHPGIKMTKDVGAAASLVALTMYGATLLLILLSYAVQYYFITQGV